MKDFQFPFVKTKVEGLTTKFNLEDPVERRKYFEAKVGPEIEKIRDYLHDGTFVSFLLGKKNSGKGTYSKLFMEAIGHEHLAHVSIGDVIRKADQDLRDPAKKDALVAEMRRRYRGFITIEEVVETILSRSQQKLLPTEAILALLEIEIDHLEHKAVFIDGFPRNMDQVSLSLFFRALMGYRDDPDFFVFIDLPEAVIDERMKYRVICPICKTPRNIRLLRTKNVGYDVATKEFYLMCDTPSCNQARMIPKEGDSQGIESIRERITIDDQVMRSLLGLQGVPKVYLRNSLPVDQAREYVDDYEITPAYAYRYDAASQHVNITEEPYTAADDDGKKSYSLLPPPVVVALIKQVAQILP
ncbi:MAG: nucleoside monophosphate kinase [Patescibacteria group bacterium]